MDPVRLNSNTRNEKKNRNQSCSWHAEDYIQTERLVPVATDGQSSVKSPADAGSNYIFSLWGRRCLLRCLANIMNIPSAKV